MKGEDEYVIQVRNNKCAHIHKRMGLETIDEYVIKKITCRTGAKL